ncbi:hypothetical protein [Kitasatospora sp. DSM 101779]|uniref:hypothetical protein n=1 Tax=Kitasatospora sp. DSM 101779 TaxID=2853165 RepID=UPI0021D9E6DE|nr:hypothetical protein [Kitasatospora sp. DSM 101779]MCU7820640.1 hypothetical protein [Kitasatospora sp. DSM 101779]
MALVIGRIEPGFLDGHPENATLVPLPPQNGGAVGWGPVYLSFGCDFGDAQLRIAVWNDTSRSWRVSALTVTSAGGRVGVPVQDGDSKVSVGRVKTSATDTGTCPIGYLIEAVLRA